MGHTPHCILNNRLKNISEAGQPQLYVSDCCLTGGASIWMFGFTCFFIKFTSSVHVLCTLLGSVEYTVYWCSVFPVDNKLNSYLILCRVSMSSSYSLVSNRMLQCSRDWWRSSCCFNVSAEGAMITHSGRLFLIQTTLWENVYFHIPNLAHWYSGFCEWLLVFVSYLCYLIAGHLFFSNMVFRQTGLDLTIDLMNAAICLGH